MPGYPTTTLAPDDEFVATVYLFADGIADTAGSGPYLIPLSQSVIDSDVVAGTMRALLDGVLLDDPAMSSAIPAGTTFSVRSLPGAAVVDLDLSAAFGSGGGSFSMRGRLAQVVFSLTAIDGVEGVAFRLDGIPTTIFGGEGVEVGSPATRAEFGDLLPAILIESPADGAGTGNPLLVDGTANVFEAVVSVALIDSDGLILFEGFAIATCGTGCRGDWSISIPYVVERPQMGSLIVWEASARDGSQTNIREHRVWLIPETTP